MQIDKKYKLEKAVLKDVSRPSLDNIHITRRHARACNGSMLALVPVKAEKGDTPGWLTPDALKLGRKLSKSFNDIQIQLNGSQVLQDGTSLRRPDEAVPPRIFKIIRNALHGKKFSIGVNIDQLKDLGDAIGTEKVILTFGKSDAAIVVRPLHSDSGELGILMPLRINP